MSCRATVAITRTSPTWSVTSNPRVTEELGTICRRRAWVVVTSQEDMDTVLGDMSKTKKQDFSKIQGRFFPPLSLSSANVDEVIQSRLLAKLPEVKAGLEGEFITKGDILKNQL